MSYIENLGKAVKKDSKKEALAQLLESSADDIEVFSYDDCLFEAEGKEFLALDDNEADQRAEEYINDSLWAFNASFIASHTRVNLDDRAIKALEKMQGELCEDANDLVRALIHDFDHFVKDAISADGRGHFLAPYDFNEEEVTLDTGETFYIYRTN